MSTPTTSHPSPANVARIAFLVALVALPLVQQAWRDANPTITEQRLEALWADPMAMPRVARATDHRAHESGEPTFTEVLMGDRTGSQHPHDR